MPWPFELDFMREALIAGVIVGAVAPLIGTFVVHRRMSLLGDGLGHVAFAGIAAGVLVDVWPIWAALVVSILAAVLLEVLRRSEAISGDLALAVMFYSGLAAGAVLINAAEAFDGSVLRYLFGSILTLSRTEVAWIAGLGVAIVAIVAVIGRALVALVIDEESARVAGLPVDALNVTLAVLTAVTVVVAMQAVGLLLVAALMVLPVGASQSLARSFRATMAGASVAGVLAVLGGLTATRAWNLAAGGAIVLCAAGLFVAAAAVGARRRGAAHALGLRDRKFR